MFGNHKPIMSDDEGYISSWSIDDIGPHTDVMRRKYDVFLSFRGEDTRASFTSHLSASLRNSGFAIFKDDHSLQRGDNISTSLIHAIEDSSISVIVFSKNYADSRWCLHELMVIMECHRTIGQVVLPVFYDVDPSEVRHLKGEFGKSFINLLNKISREEESTLLGMGYDLLWRDEICEGSKAMIQKRRDALHAAGGLAGFVVLNSRLFI